MQIEKIALANFRGLINSTLDFSPGINLIIGINGAGKTSVLEALRIVLAKSVPAFVEQPLSFPGIGLTRSDITLDRGATSITCRMSRLGQSFELTVNEQRDAVNDALQRDKFGGTGTQDVSPPITKRRTRRPSSGDLRLEGTLRGQTSAGTQGSLGLVPMPDAAMQQARPLPLVLYMSVRRAIVTNAISNPGSRLPAYQRAFAEDRGLGAQQLSDWWRGRAALVAEQPHSRAARQLSAVERALQALLPHLSNWRVESNELTVTKVVEVDRIDGEGRRFKDTESRQLPLRMLSDGERSLAAIGSDIAQRLVLLNDTSDDPIATGIGVVLIDELDLHLHPQWQRTVLDGLRSAFPMLQFICTTHSLFLIQAQRTGNLIRLDDIGDEERPAENFHQKSIEDIAEEVQHIQMPQKSQRYLDMMAAAEQYFSLLRDADARSADLDALKQRLDELAVPFSDDPAYQALLKQQRLLVLGPGAA